MENFRDTRFYVSGKLENRTAHGLWDREALYIKAFVLVWR